MTPEQIADQESVWKQIAEKCPAFLPLRENFENYHAVREIVLSGSVTWAGVHQRWKPAPGMKVMDVGANVGVFSAYAAIHGAKVVAYEPFNKAFEHLSALIWKLKPNLSAYHAAIGKTSGQTAYLGTESRIEDGCTTFNGSVPTDGVVWNDADRDRSETVNMISFSEAIGDTTWDCVKCDIEGTECEMILGTPIEDLKRIRFMYLEMHPWVEENQYKRTLSYLEEAFNVTGAYWNEEIGRWEAVYAETRA